MKICCIITTYDNRSNFVVKIVKRLISEKISKIIILNNNSCHVSKQKLDKLSEIYPLIDLINFKKNIGTAKAIKFGLKKASSSKDIDFIWILDDDNLPKKNTVKYLLGNYLIAKKNYTKVFTPIRYNLEQYKRYLKGYYDFKFYENNFIKFNIIKNFLNLLFKKKLKVKKVEKIQMAPYGGLFFHKSLIDTVGFPNTKFVTYGDDYDYTYRMTKKKFSILIDKKYLVKDLSPTFGSKSYFDKEIHEKKIYYQLRNHTYISKKFITNKLYYNINMCLFIIYLVTINILNIFNPFFFQKRLRLILKAIRDGNSIKNL